MTPLLVLTIGQAPRPDLEHELGAVLGPERPIEVRGALDGLPLAEIERLAPINDADALHCHLPSGHDVIISKKDVTTRLGALLEADPGRPTVVACTGRFVGLPAVPNVLYPSGVLRGLVDAVLPPGSRLGVLVPIPEQVESFVEYWNESDRPAIVRSVKPGSDPTEVADELAAAGVDLTVLDCFGYSRALRDQVRAITGRPVLSASRCTAQVALEMLG